MSSFYTDTIVLLPENVVSVLATATLFQHQSLIDKCLDAMKETVDEETVIKYYNAATTYGCSRIKHAVTEWLEANLCTFLRLNLLIEDRKSLSMSVLVSIPVELMTTLVKSQNLIPLSDEYSIYILLKNW